jgi:hypothetical protein
VHIGQLALITVLARPPSRSAPPASRPSG